MKTVREVAVELRVDPETVRRWCRTGELQAICISRKKGYLIDDAVLEAFLEKRPKYGVQKSLSVADQNELMRLRVQRDLLVKQVRQLNNQIETFSRQIDEILGAL